jgi:glycosyltransferase involved in cell wall biosynthesis
MTLWLAILGAWLSGIPVLIREEQTLLHERPLPRELARKTVMRILFRFARGLYIGSNNYDFFRAYGMSSDRLFPAPYCVDNETLQGRAHELVSVRAQIRARLSVAGAAPVILFVGKLSPKKDPMTLLEAFRRVRSSSPCQLLIVGDGPLKEEMRRQIASADVPDVVFAGFLNRSEIAEAFVAADIFCLPSLLHETWGIVVNEAMNFSLPVVASDKVGCARDLVQPGKNGLVVAAGNAHALEEALADLVVDPEQRREYGNKSLELISAWHYGLAADGIVAASRAATGRDIAADLVSKNG